MKIITFGEIMGRLAAPGFLRFGQCLPGSVDVTFAGAEANVAASLAMFKAEVEFVTALPANSIADACVASLRTRGVGTQHIIRRDGRLGMYFLETGANQRPSQVIYDREATAISRATADEYEWLDVFADADWFHISGITPAISRAAAKTSLAALEAAKEQNVSVSCDLNFRKKLWRWDDSMTPRELAEETMRNLLPLVDVVIANEEDCQDVLSIQAEDTDVDSGQLSVDRYPEVARKVVADFPNLRQVAITLRESISASHNNWGAMLYDVDSDSAYFAPERDGEYEPYEIKNIVDRVGGGDSFAAGLIFALNTPKLAAPELAIQFATAASCLAHSIVGDFNFSSRAEVEALMHGSASGRVIR